MMSIIKPKKKPHIIKNWREQPKSIEKYQFVYAFLPHPEEKRRAALLSHKAIVIYCVAMLLIAGLFRLLPSVVPGVLGYASNISVKDLLEYTNNKRRDSGLSELRLNAALSNAAKLKAEDMFNNQYWAHISPSGKEPWDFILGQNYDYIYAGENLAKNFNNSKDVVEAWMKSQSHKENLLSPNYDEIGFAVVNGVMDGYETTLVVQMFGRPRNAAQVASVYEEQAVLEKESKPAAATSERESSAATTGVAEGAPAGEMPVYTPSEAPEGPVIDVTGAAKTVSAVFGGFVGTLLALDVWYSRKKQIRKFSGHTLAHLGVLVLVVASIWFVLTPGIVL